MTSSKERVTGVAWRSPEMSPEWKGLNRGASAVSRYPERVSNPHGAKPQGILSSCGVATATVQTVANRALTETRTHPDRPESRPNNAYWSPEMSPEGLGHNLTRSGAPRGGGR